MGWIILKRLQFLLMFDLIPPQWHNTGFNSLSRKLLHVLSKMICCLSSCDLMTLDDSVGIVHRLVKFVCVCFLHFIGQMYVLYGRGRVTHICISKLTIIGSDNDLSPGRRQAIIWTNDRILLIRTLGTNFSEILSEIWAFSFKKMYMKMSSAKWRPFYLCLNVVMWNIEAVVHRSSLYSDTCMCVIMFITHAPLFRGGADHVYESPLGDSCFGNEYS